MLRSPATRRATVTELAAETPAAFATSGWRIGVDIGGTFTDLVAIAPNGSISVFKVPSVPADPASGVLAALDAAATAIALPISNLLSRTVLFAHGSTIATNTLLEGRGARVGERTIGAQDAGCLALRWARELDRARVGAIEDCRHVSRRLEQALRRGRRAREPLPGQADGRVPARQSGDGRGANFK